jgi:toxin ParE1/3/4
MANYSLSKEAKNDINEILIFIAEDNIDAAVLFNVRLEETLNLLGRNPLAGRERNDLREGLRSFPHGGYVVFYQLWAGKVAITRVLHAARDLDEIFS